MSRILDLLFGGAYRLRHSVLAHTALSRILLAEAGYPVRVYIHADTYARPRLPFSAFTRLRAEVHHETPIPLAAWTGKQLNYSYPDVSEASNLDHAVRLAVYRIQEDVIAARRGARPMVEVAG